MSTTADDNCLVIRNLTPDFSYYDRDEMFYGLGATSVHNYPRSSIIFCRSEHDCHMVLRLLHQRHLHGRRLRVEFASRQQRQQPLHCHWPPDVALRRKIREGQFEAFDSIRKESNLPTVNSGIVARIVEHLLQNNELYRQVLLLMMQYGFDPFCDDSTVKSNNSNVELDSITLPVGHDDEDEVEFESEPIRFESPAPQAMLERRKRKRRKLKTGLISDEKRRKVGEKGQRASVKLTTVIEEVFDEKVKVLEKKDLKIIVHRNTEDSDRSSNDHVELQQTIPTLFGTITTLPLSSSTSTEHKLSPPLTFDLVSLSQSELISECILESNRIAPFRWHEFSVFQGYHPGQPGLRLYVKNLYKKVTLRDLYRLYARFIDLSSKVHLESFNINYMEKGRMRGQAFVTFPTVQLAQRALQQTNGFCFYDRPIVVAFARSGKTPET